jgi:hypothetical protein
VRHHKVNYILNTELCQEKQKKCCAWQIARRKTENASFVDLICKNDLQKDEICIII